MTQTQYITNLLLIAIVNILFICGAILNDVYYSSFSFCIGGVVAMVVMYKMMYLDR